MAYGRRRRFPQSPTAGLKSAPRDKAVYLNTDLSRGVVLAAVRHLMATAEVTPEQKREAERLEARLVNRNVAAAAVAPIPPNPRDASLNALVAMEKALALKAKTIGKVNPVTKRMEFPPDMQKGFDLYQKAKALALRPGTEGEEAAALRVALLTIVKLVF